MYPANTGFITYDTEDILTSLSEVAKLQSNSSELKTDENSDETKVQD